MKLFVFLCLLPITFSVHEKDLNKPRKDKYYLHKNCEIGLNKQINEEKRASLMYETMASHFSQNTVARPGFAKLFSERASELHERSQKFMDYLNERGGLFSGFEVKMPTKYLWNNGLEALRDAVDIEKHLNNKLYGLHDIAALQCVDQHLMDYLEDEFLERQVKSIDALLRHISVLKEMDTGMGEYLFDRKLLGKAEL